MCCNKADIVVLRRKWWHIHSRLSGFNLTPSLTEITSTHKTQLLWTIEDKILCYTKEIIPIRVLRFENAVLKKVKANFRVDFAPFLKLTFSLVEFSQFYDWMFRKNFSNRSMIHQSYFFINVLLINLSRLLALIDCIYSTGICV